MKPLIDADILRYEIGSCGEFINEDGEKVVRDFSSVAQLLDDKINEICELVWATEDPVLFLTMDDRTNKILNGRKKTKEPCKENFRLKVAKTKPYKDTRNHEKCYHYDNITAYMLGKYHCEIAEGYEADDLMSIWQTNSLRDGGVETIICTRDKDLKMVDGNHFSWACGTRDATGPLTVEGVGYLEAIKKVNNKTGKSTISNVKGVGFIFFCAQLIMGDSVDNIPGLKGHGPKAAYTLLEGCQTAEEALSRVLTLYSEVLGDEWEECFQEQANLLWMVRELDENGTPILFNYKDYVLDQ